MWVCEPVYAGFFVPGQCEMRFSVLTIFPDMFGDFMRHGIVRRAIEKGLIQVETTDLRRFAEGRHRVTDDRPYGGGCGMVMKPEPLIRAIQSAKAQLPEAMTILLTPQGRTLDQPLAADLARQPALVLVCGRYEGVDERVKQDHVDAEMSIGDFVMTGGELAAMVVIDAVTRLLPDALGDEDSAHCDSFSQDLLDHAHYTRPPEYDAAAVPAVLRSGDHQAVAQWRMESALVRTLLKRPDLLTDRALTREELTVLARFHDHLRRILEKAGRLAQ